MRDDDQEKRLFIVTPQDKGQRIDRFLSLKNPTLSRSYIKRLSNEQRISVNNGFIKPSYILKGGEEIAVNLPHEKEKTFLEPDDIPLDIHYEDDDIVVVNKSAGLTVHPGAGISSGTLVNALIHKKIPLSSVGWPWRPGIVHRLDKGTSGLMVIAKNDISYNVLREQFSAHSIKRDYIALVYGKLPEKGEIDTPLGRSERDRKRISTRSKKSRTAITFYRTLKRYKDFTLLFLTLGTGRTHQIRVHLSSIGNPVVGDPTYGGRKRVLTIMDEDIRKVIMALKRPILHAKSLGFIHPGTLKFIEFDSPLPPEITEILNTLEEEKW